MAKNEAAKDESREEDKGQRAQAVALVKMFKDGRTIEVHPTCVAAHKQAFWKVVLE